MTYYYCSGKDEVILLGCLPLPSLHITWPATKM